MRGRVWMAVLTVVGSAVLVMPARADSDRSDDLQRIRSAREVFESIMQAPDNAIPQELLQSSKCVAIIPSEKKAAFLFGGQYGKGVASCRTAHGWSAPAFLVVAGGSFGLQFGGNSTDLVLVFRTENGLQHLLSDKFKIGGDATAAAGPVGRHVSASTDLEMHAEIMTYSRSRGAFAGVSLDGAVVEADKSGDRALYGDTVAREKILTGGVTVPAAARPLLTAIARSAG